MRAFKAIAVMAFALLVSGCATGPDNLQDPEFEAQQSTNPDGVGNTPSYSVVEVNVDVPESLIVSEANSYFPRGDIVWRGDPPGNRHEQVAAIFQDGMTRGVADMEGDVPVDLEIEVLRFHSLTEKTRYTVGGVHSIRFMLSLKDPQTGELVEEPRKVQADLKGYGGSRAIAADQQGQTQKVRITDHLAQVINAELTSPDGYENPRLGVIQFIDNRF